MKRSNRGWLIGSVVGFALTALGLLGAGLQWVLQPPRELCPLPALPVVEPISDFVWSFDGRLLAAGQGTEAWIVEFPSQQAEQLPTFPQPINRIGWDREGVPWVMHHGGLARLREDGTGWEQFPTARLPLVSPTGRWRAEVRQAAPIHPSGRRPRPRLAIRPHQAGLPDPKLDLPLELVSRYAWQDDNTLLIHHDGLPQRLRVAEGRLEYLCPKAPPSRRLPRGNYEARSGAGEDLYEWMLARRIPGFPSRRFRDRRLAVFDPTDQLLVRIPVGRRHWGQGFKSWEAVKTSPDGRFIVFRAADDTLRALDLENLPGR